MITVYKNDREEKERLRKTKTRGTALLAQLTAAIIRGDPDLECLEIIEQVGFLNYKGGVLKEACHVKN
jgi:hypothetical protein